VRVAHLVDRPTAIGGVSTYLEALVPALGMRGVESFVLTDARAVPTFAGAPCVHVDAVSSDAAALDPNERRQLLEALETTGADVVYAHVARNPDIVIAASERMPVVFFAHDYYPVCCGSMRYLHRSDRLCEDGVGVHCLWRAYTERTTNRRPDRLVRAYRRARAWQDAWPHLARVFAASPFVADLLAADGVPRDRLAIVPYFVDFAEPSDVTAEQDVLYLGRLVREKGVHVLLRALARLAGVTARIAGDGPDRPVLEDLAHELGIADRVCFMGWVPPHARFALLNASRIAVLPSLWDEPFGISGVEALAAGVPVVGTAVGGIPSWLTSGEGGLLVPRANEVALAEAMHWLLTDANYYAAQVSAARAVAARFSVDRHLELLLPELEDAAAGAALRVN
jgi:glycosyltransferase involved in cell wall biosynthesis